jgi:hypothetical protein
MKVKSSVKSGANNAKLCEDVARYMSFVRTPNTSNDKADLGFTLDGFSLDGQYNYLDLSLMYIKVRQVNANERERQKTSQASTTAP